jgi:hypothetical protein
MKPRTRFPDKVEDVQLRFFGHFTWKDILRITAPAALLYTVTEPVYTPVIGLIIGFVFSQFTVYNRTLDQHLYQFIRFHSWRKL